MILMFEGMDRCGKDTQAKNMIDYFVDCSFHQIHYTKTPQLRPEASKTYVNRLYRGMFKMIKSALDSDQHLLLNRAHLGEHVYGHYRGYDGSYVFDLELAFKCLMDDIYLFVFVDEPRAIMDREDGESWAKTYRAKQDEKARFEDAFYMSNIVNKTLININGKDIQAVEAIILDRLLASRVYK